MMTKNEILSKLREIKPVLYKDYSVTKIGIFGSYPLKMNQISLS
jgi:hypothetical protein